MLSGTSLPLLTYSAAFWPSAVLPAISARKMSPVDRWVKPYFDASTFDCVPLPEPGAPRRMTIKLAAPHVEPALAHLALLQEAFVVAHDQLRLELAHRVEGHAHDDQQGRAAEVERHVELDAQ